MFKFNFNIDNQKPITNVVYEKSCDHDESCYNVEMIPITQNYVDNLNIYKLNTFELLLDDIHLKYSKANQFLHDIQVTQTEETKDISLADQNHSDLIPGVYEGGAKVWECTNDLLEYMCKNVKKSEFADKFVLDLGCGSGHLGIYAHKCGATVHFQDYNKDVIETITIPNVLINTDNLQVVNVFELNNTFKFYCGDWSKFSTYTKNDPKFDLILTSETIYNPKNQHKLLDIFDCKLKPKGRIILAAKTYYFGVGGGLRQFEILINQDKRFISEVKWSSNIGISREIMELRRSNETNTL